MYGRRSISIDTENTATSSPRRSSRIKTNHLDSPLQTSSSPSVSDIPTRRTRRSQSIQEKSLSDIQDDLKQVSAPLSSKNSVEQEKLKVPARRTRRSASEDQVPQNETKEVFTRTKRSQVKENLNNVEKIESNTEDETDITKKRRSTRSASKSPQQTSSTSSVTTTVRRRRLSLTDKQQGENKIGGLDIITENENEFEKTVEAGEVEPVKSENTINTTTQENESNENTGDISLKTDLISNKINVENQHIAEERSTEVVKEIVVKVEDVLNETRKSIKLENKETGALEKQNTSSIKELEKQNDKFLNTDKNMKFEDANVEKEKHISEKNNEIPINNKPIDLNTNNEKKTKEESPNQEQLEKLEKMECEVIKLIESSENSLDFDNEHDIGTEMHIKQDSSVEIVEKLEIGYTEANNLNENASKSFEKIVEEKMLRTFDTNEMIENNDNVENIANKLSQTSDMSESFTTTLHENKTNISTNSKLSNEKSQENNKEQQEELEKVTNEEKLIIELPESNISVVEENQLTNNLNSTTNLENVLHEDNEDEKYQNLSLVNEDGRSYSPIIETNLLTNNKNYSKIEKEETFDDKSIEKDALMNSSKTENKIDKLEETEELNISKLFTSTSTPYSKIISFTMDTPPEIEMENTSKEDVNEINFNKKTNCINTPRSKNLQNSEDNLNTSKITPKQDKIKTPLSQNRNSTRNKITNSIKSINTTVTADESSPTKNSDKENDDININSNKKKKQTKTSEVLEKNREKLINDLIATYNAESKRKRETNEDSLNEIVTKKLCKDGKSLNFSDEDDYEDYEDDDDDNDNNEVEENEDDDDEENSNSNFIDDMASVGSEDTPSIDSNEIIDEGESINSNDDELDAPDTDDTYENDSFVCDDDEGDRELLSGEEDFLGAKVEPKKARKSRIIPIESDSDSDDVNNDTNDNNHGADVNVDAEKESEIDRMSMEAFGGQTPSEISEKQVSTIDSDLESIKANNEELSRQIETGTKPPSPPTIRSEPDVPEPTEESVAIIATVNTTTTIINNTISTVTDDNNDDDDVILIADETLDLQQEKNTTIVDDLNLNKTFDAEKVIASKLSTEDMLKDFHDLPATEETTTIEENVKNIDQDDDNDTVENTKYNEENEMNEDNVFDKSASDDLDEIDNRLNKSDDDRNDNNNNDDDDDDADNDNNKMITNDNNLEKEVRKTTHDKLMEKYFNDVYKKEKRRQTIGENATVKDKQSQNRKRQSLQTNFADTIDAAAIKEFETFCKDLNEQKNKQVNLLNDDIITSSLNNSSSGVGDGGGVTSSNNQKKTIFKRDSINELIPETLNNSSLGKKKRSSLQQPNSNGNIDKQTSNVSQTFIKNKKSASPALDQKQSRISYEYNASGILVVTPSNTSPLIQTNTFETNDSENTFVIKKKTNNDFFLVTPNKMESHDDNDDNSNVNSSKKKQKIEKPIKQQNDNKQPDGVVEEVIEKSLKKKQKEKKTTTAAATQNKKFVAEQRNSDDAHDNVGEEETEKSTQKKMKRKKKVKKSITDNENFLVEQQNDTEEQGNVIEEETEKSIQKRKKKIKCLEFTIKQEQEDYDYDEFFKEETEKPLTKRKTIKKRKNSEETEEFTIATLKTDSKFKDDNDVDDSLKKKKKLKNKTNADLEMFIEDVDETPTMLKKNKKRKIVRTSEEINVTGNNYMAMPMKKKRQNNKLTTLQEIEKPKKNQQYNYLTALKEIKHCASALIKSHTGQRNTSLNDSISSDSSNEMQRPVKYEYHFNVQILKAPILPSKSEYIPDEEYIPIKSKSKNVIKPSTSGYTGPGNFITTIVKPVSGGVQKKTLDKKNKHLKSNLSKFSAEQLLATNLVKPIKKSSSLKMKK